jgi:L-asparagine oxygenase
MAAQGSSRRSIMLVAMRSRITELRSPGWAGCATLPRDTFMTTTISNRAARERLAYVDLDSRERDAVSRLARSLASGVAGGSVSLAGLTARAADRLPARLTSLRDEVSAASGSRSHWVVRGLPIDQQTLGATPGSWRERTPQVTPEECVLLLLARALGDVFAWADQQGGAVVHDIVPAAGEEDSMLSSSSTKEMSLHTEDAFFAERADLILLLCLRNPSHAPTYIADIRDVALSQELGQLVRSPRYRFLADDSHDGSGPRSDPGGFPVVPPAAQRESSPSVLVSGSDADPRIRFDGDYTDTPGDDDASEAVKALDRALHAVHTEVVLRPGELLIIDNNRCVHGRGGFHASHDGQDRWLKRVNVSTARGPA